MPLSRFWMTIGLTVAALGLAAVGVSYFFNQWPASTVTVLGVGLIIMLVVLKFTWLERAWWVFPLVGAVIVLFLASLGIFMSLSCFKHR